MNIKNVVLSCVTYILWLLIVPPFLVLSAVLALLPASIRYDNRLYYAITSTMSWLILKATFIRCCIRGKENLPLYPQNPAIIIANHGSALDIPILEIIAGAYPRVWFVKHEYKKIPIMGFLIKRLHVAVNRSDSREGLKALISMINMIKNAPRHVVLFPEGTRYNDGKIHDFYAGFAAIAQKTKRPVIPVVITGLHKTFPKKSILIDSSAGQVTITIGRPIYYDDQREIADFVKDVQQYFEKELQNAGN